MDILHVYRSIDRKEGGPATSVPALCRELSFLNDCKVSLLTCFIGDETSIENVGYTEIIQRGYGKSEILSVFLKVLPILPALVSNKDIIHLHSVWPPMNSVVAFYALLKKKKLVVTPRANLMPEDVAKTFFKKLKKIIAWHLYIKFWTRKAVFHVTAEHEYNAVKNIWHKGEIIQIPNGINVDEFKKLPPKNIVINIFPELKGKKIILFLARIVRNKGLHLLAHSWGKLASGFPDWHLLIVGQGNEKYRKEILKILNEYNLQGRYTFSGHLTGEKKLSAYNAADLFVLPTYWENFGIVIAEALMADTPVITTTKAPWNDIVSQKCGWVIEPDQEELNILLKKVLQISQEELGQMGKRGGQFVKEKYDWRNIALKMREFYMKILLTTGKKEQI